MVARAALAAAMVLASIGNASPRQLRYFGGFAPCTITSTPRRGQHIGWRSSRHPGSIRRRAWRLRTARQRADAKAARRERACRGAADAAGHADDERDGSLSFM